ncbi:histidine kinase [Streptomyces sp. NPDC058773]|uniref:sensor histidine kinase n=1 Tax=Streptomyces sp. NPDC058773 TaxID=3346632 RepID=UPI00367CEEA3
MHTTPQPPAADPPREPGPAHGPGLPREADPDARWLGPVFHVAFFLLLGASLARFLLRHPGEPRTPWIIALSLVLGLLYVLGPSLGSRPHQARRPTARRLLWLGAVVATWVVLVLLAPSFAWCAVPLFYTGLRTLPAGAASLLVGVLTVFVVVAQLRLSTGPDPNLLLAPPAVAALATAVFVHMERQAVRQRALIDDLIRTRRELAATERRAGTLAERQRLSMEIHDTLAQGLSSQQMLLQATARTWDSDPATARGHIRTATEITARNLAEARRFVHDLAPADLADGTSLPEALRELAARTTQSELHSGPPPSPRKQPTVRQAPERQAAVQEPADEGPAARQPGGERPAARQPGGERPAAQRPAVQGPTVQGPAVPRSTARQSAAEQSAAQQPAAQQPAAPPGPGPRGPVTVRFREDGTLVPLPDRVASALLRIAQGALANVREHAAATTVTLTLSYLGDQVVLDIADDGRGFTPPPAPYSPSAPVAPATAADRVRGHGLPAMYARMRQLGGTLTIESTPGEGTVLSAAVPLEHTP